jgi:hypothetical protein
VTFPGVTFPRVTDFAKLDKASQDAYASFISHARSPS